MEQPYKPIACHIHDQLLDYATLRISLAVQIQSGGELIALEAKIVDIYTQSGAEFIRFDNGQTYRLDQLVTAVPRS